MTEPEIVHLVQLATVVEESTLWPPPVVTSARQQLVQLCGHVPSLEQLGERFTAETVYSIAARMIEQRDVVQRETDEELGEHSPCHLCGAPRDHNDLDYLFGLAQVASSKMHWGASVASLAANALTLPLGVFVAAAPGSSTRAYIKRCRLVMCGLCGNARKGSFWNNHELRVSPKDCRKHPSWNRLQAAGYTTFLDHRRLQQFH